MFIKKTFLFLLIASSSYTKASCQQGDFCSAITTIIHDAPNKFRNIRGNLIEANQNATFWASGITVPGTIGSRFVFSMGLYYEDAVLQTKEKGDLKAVYDKYKALLDNCLKPQGYVMTQNENFYPGLANYKKIVFMLDEKDEKIQDAKGKTKPAPAHVTMEATYNKDVDKYTIVIYIFEH